MTFHKFENEIKDTLAKYIRDKVEIERYTELMLGLYEEGAEVVSIIRKSIPGNFHETEIDLPHLEEELGDILWYISHIDMQLQKDNLQNLICGDSSKSQEVSMAEYEKTVKLLNEKAPRLPESQLERGRYFAMGLIKEIGQLATVFGENLINYENLDKNNVERKLRSSLWYVTSIGQNYGLDLETIAKKNIQKTKARYNKNGIAQIPKTEEGR